MDIKDIKLQKHFKNSIYCITDQEHSSGRSNIKVVEEMLEAGIKIIQYREKNKEKLEKLRECKIISEMVKREDGIFIVNDDIDIAILSKADGIHIGQDDLPIEDARSLVGDKMIIGVSTHNINQARKAKKNGADYIGVGPIFKTFTKKNVCDPVGIKYMKEVIDTIDILFVAIGGIKENNIKKIREAGAECICLVTEITEADDIKGKIKKLKNICGFSDLEDINLEVHL